MSDAKAGAGAGEGTRVRVAIVTNIPAPYRLPVYAHLAAQPGIELRVFFCSGTEPDRKWKLDRGDFDQVFLRERFISFRGRFIHINPDIWSSLRGFAPDVVITTGFNPTHLLAFAYARMHGVQHVPMTDGTLNSEVNLTLLHRLIRRWVYGRSKAFVAASQGGFDLYRSYGIPAQEMFKSHLCIDNAAYAAVADEPKRFDFIFCGRMVEVKNPLFALEVAAKVAQRIGRKVSIVYVGSGELEPELRAAAARHAQWVDTTIAGFAQQDQLPRLYAQARVFLFPSSWDPWGVVANEACAAGLPVIVTPAAGVAGELVRNGSNGFVLRLDLERWADVAAQLLTDENLLRTMSEASRRAVSDYTHRNAALGAAAAVRLVRGLPFEDHPAIRPFPMRPKVMIMQRRMTHYRLPLFEGMRSELDRRGIELRLVHGTALPEEEIKKDGGDLPWSTLVPCKYWLGGRLCWQNAWPLIHGTDLIIVTQENKLLFNYVLLFMHRWHAWAFWGHGRNFQNRSQLADRGERFKRWLLRKADWWFAYTQTSADVVEQAGYPPERITVLNNAIDTGALRRDLESVTDADVAALRAELGLGDAPVGLMLGSLYADKRPDFAMQAVELIRRQVPEFRLLVVGDGKQAHIVKEAAARSGRAIQWLGVRKGRDKAVLLKLSQLLFNPGLVGLNMLDSLLSGVPLLTTDCGLHSPEIAYLDSGRNGVMTPDRLEDYVAAVVQLVRDEPLRARLSAACLEDAKEISLDRMVERFCDGIERCLRGRGRLGAQNTEAAGRPRIA